MFSDKEIRQAFWMDLDFVRTGGRKKSGFAPRPPAEAESIERSRKIKKMRLRLHIPNTSKRRMLDI